MGVKLKIHFHSEQEPAIPVMYVAFIITNSNCYISHFVYVKMRVVLMIIRGDPAHPDATGLLPRKHSHRVVVLVKQDDSRNFNIKNIRNAFFSVFLFIHFGLTVVVLRMMSTSSLSSGTTSSTKRGMVGTTGGGLISAAFLALKRKLKISADIL